MESTSSSSSKADKAKGLKKLLSTIFQPSLSSHCGLNPSNSSTLVHQPTSNPLFTDCHICKPKHKPKLHHSTSQDNLLDPHHNFQPFNLLNLFKPKTKPHKLNDNLLFTSEEEEDDNQREDRSNVLSSRTSEEESLELSVEKKKEKEGLAVVKQTKDAYGDFKSSVLDMIVEYQIVEVRDFEELLKSYLRINESCHHGVILKVFSDVWEHLFSSSSAG